MNQKPSAKKGEKNTHETTLSRTPAEQQQLHRKGDRPTHVQDVAKPGGSRQPVNHGYTNGQLESGRAVPNGGANSVAPVAGAQNGNRGRSNGHADGRSGTKASSTQPQSSGGGPPQPMAGKPGVIPANGNGGTRPSSGAAAARGAAVQPAAGGRRGRDTSAAVDAHPDGGAVAAGSVAVESAGLDGLAGGRSRDGRRRGGRGRAGGGAATAAGDGSGAHRGDDAGDVAVNGAAAGNRDGERAGRQRGGRRQHGDNADGPIAERVANQGAPERVAVDGGAAASGGTAQRRGDAAQGDLAQGDRAGRGRGRRGRGGQQGGGPDQSGEGGEQPQQGDAGREQQERKPKSQRARPPRPSRGQDGQAMGGVGTQPTGGQEPEPADSQRQSADGKEPRHRQGRGKELKPQSMGQKPVAMEEAEAAEQGGAGAPRVGGRSRGGRRRNGEDGSTVNAGNAAQQQGADSTATGVADGVRRQRPPRQPRQPNPQQQQLQGESQQQPSIEPLPAAQASHLLHSVQHAPQNVQLGAVPQQQAPPQQPQSSQSPMAPPLQQQQPQPSQAPVPPQPQYMQQAQFPEGQPLLDYTQQLLQQHMVPQQQYPQQEYHQQHFLQPPPALQHFQHSFQHFHQQQHFLDQHLGPPAPASSHGFLGGPPFGVPGGPMVGGPSFYGPGPDMFGQLLPPQAFAGAASLPIAQAAMPAAAPEQQHASSMPVPVPPEPQAQPPQPQLPMVAPSAHVQAAEPQGVAATVTSVAVAADRGLEPEASVASAADSISAAPATETVKNEWAERLAQQALARMYAKSSFLAGSGSSADGLPPAARGSQGSPSPAVGRLNAAGSPRTAASGSGVTYSAEPENRTYADAEGGRRNVSYSSEPWRSGSGGPAGDIAYDRRSSLAPTGAADAADAWRARGTDDEAAPVAPAPPAPAPYQPPRREETQPPPPGATAAASRPRLNLQPRTKPLPAAPAGAVAAPPNAMASDAPSANGTAGAAAASRPSIFGAARPREEVLRERGVTEPERLTIGSVAQATGISPSSSAIRIGGRAGSVTSGASEDDQWQTVGKGGKSKRDGVSDVGIALLDAGSDLFFSSKTAGHGVAIVGRSGGQHGSYGKGSYGSYGRGGDSYMSAYGASRGYGNDEDPIFKRSLPTRNDNLF